MQHYVSCRRARVRQEKQLPKTQAAAGDAQRNLLARLVTDTVNREPSDLEYLSS